MASESDIIKEAKVRYKRCEEYETYFRTNYDYDLKFVNGDSNNLFQWPEMLQLMRGNSDRPTLTINKTKIHCKQIENDVRQNQSQIRIKPVGNGATFKAAQIREGIVRHIENKSNAQSAYSNAFYHQVRGGYGVWKVECDYADESSFDQDIFIRRIADPMSVYIDPDIEQADGSDMRFAFIYKDMARDDFETEYGKKTDDIVDNSSPLGVGEHDNWNDEHHVRICEYFRKVIDDDWLYELDNGSTVKESQVKIIERQMKDRRNDNDETMLDTLKRHMVRKRRIDKATIERYLIAGSEIIEKNIFPGKYIPIVRLIGEEVVINGVMDRIGHVRGLIDPQRMLNYYASGSAEHVALSTKVPYIAEQEAIQGFEDIWRTANIENYTYLPYNGYDDKGQRDIPAPQRIPPPIMPPAFQAGMQDALQQMMMVSGQYEANLGQKSNEVSGRAVEERRRQGNNATYNYLDRYQQALGYTGNIINGLISVIYDTERTMKILGEDGSEALVNIDPNIPQAHQQIQDEDDEDNFNPQEVSAALNPTVGEYSVFADIGPAYESKRMEMFDALTQIMAQNKEIAAIAGDLLFKAADFPGADEVAKRLKRMVPPKALGQDQPDPQVQQLQQLLAKQHETMMQAKQDTMEMQQKLWQAQAKSATEELQKQIDIYKAETDRIKAVGQIYPEGMQLVLQDLISTVRQTDTNVAILQQRLQEQLLPGSDVHMDMQEKMHDMLLQKDQQAHEQNMASMQHDQNMEAMGQQAQNNASAQAADQQHQAAMAEQAQNASAESGPE